MLLHGSDIEEEGNQHPYLLCQVRCQTLTHPPTMGHQRLGEGRAGPQLQLHSSHPLQADPTHLFHLL